MVCCLLLFSTCREYAYIKAGFCLRTGGYPGCTTMGIYCFCPWAWWTTRGQAKEPKSGRLSKDVVGKSDVVDVMSQTACTLFVFFEDRLRKTYFTYSNAHHHRAVDQNFVQGITSGRTQGNEVPDLPDLLKGEIRTMSRNVLIVVAGLERRW